MDSSNIYNHSKVSDFNKIVTPRIGFYRFSKISKIGEHLKHFLVLSYDYVPSLSQFLSIDKLLKITCQSNKTITCL